MFGFLRGPGGDADYRRCYARCCSFQHLIYGVTATPVLSYEAVFLYVLATDAGYLPPLPQAAPTCCRMQTTRRFLQAPDAAVGRFCAAAGILLAGIKLDDDIRDSRSWLARAARLMLARPIRAATKVLESVDRQFPDRARAYIERHLRLERTYAHGIPLHEYVAPTAAAFGDLFGVFGRLLGKRTETELSRLIEIGSHVGAAIVAADCAADWRLDQQNGSFNPLREATEVQGARTIAQQHLASAGFACNALCRQSSMAPGVLRAAFDRIDLRIREQAGTNRASSRKPMIRRLRGGDCDCACDGPGPDGCDGSDSGCVCFCCDCYVCEPCCDRERRAKTKTKKTHTETLLGRTGYTNGSLRPSGAVVIDGMTHPARSDHGFIEGGTKVKVVQEDNFGVVVRKVEDDASR